MVILGIANTLDLPSQLMSRISSRMGNSRLVFTPYKSSQIKDIISQRLVKTDLFNKYSIDYISKKVACVSSDIRKTLSICRQAVENYKLMYEKDKNSVPKKIDINMVIKTMENTYSTPMNSYVKQSTNPTKYLLVSIFLEMQNTQSRFAEFNKVYGRFSSISHMNNEPKFSSLEMKEIAHRLMEVGILDFRMSSRTKKYEISLKTNIDDLSYSLMGEECFQKHAAAYL